MRKAILGTGLLFLSLSQLFAANGSASGLNAKQSQSSVEQLRQSPAQVAIKTNTQAMAGRTTEASSSSPLVLVLFGVILLLSSRAFVKHTVAGTLCSQEAPKIHASGEKVKRTSERVA